MGRTRNRNRVNVTGRNQTSRFVRLDYRMLHCNAYRSLSPNARSLLIELTMLYNGSNNGSLYLSVRDAAHRMGVADLTAAGRAFDDLVGLGFITMTQESHFRVKAAESSRARCWRLAWEPGPGRKAPTWDFIDREPAPRTAAHKRMDRGLRTLKTYRKARDLGRLPVLESETMEAIRPEYLPGAVLESHTPKVENGGLPSKCRVRDSATHIAIPWGEGARSNLIGWWEPDWAPHLAAIAFASTLASNQWSKAA